MNLRNVSHRSFLRLIAFASFAGSLSHSSAQTSNSPWVATWAVGPSIHSVGSTGDDGLIFSQQTMREIAHTSIGGTAARVHLSNEFGMNPLTVSDVHIAQVNSASSDGSAILPQTDHVVTFGGSRSVTIPAGANIVSDSIPFTVPALANVAVSIFFPNDSSLVSDVTSHQFTAQTNFFTSGDVSSATDFTNSPQTGNYYFLTGIDVQGQALTGSVATIGASITAGFMSSPNANHRWPDFLAKRFQNAGMLLGVANVGIAGNHMLDDQTDDGPSLVHRFSQDALSQAGVKYVVVSDDPINDLGSNRDVPLSQFTQALESLSSQAHAQGIKFICSTLTPFEGSSGFNSTSEATRDQYNAFVLTPESEVCDGVIDQAKATADPNNPEMYLPVFDSGDHLHPNDAGYQAIANAIDLGLFTQPGSTAQVDLSNAFNREGIVTDGTSFPNSGLDGSGFAYSSNILGKSQNFAGATLTFGPTNQSNAVSAMGQMLTLPQGQFGTLLMLGTGVAGNRVGQVFTITYTDGTTTNITQSLSDWGTPQNFPGETVVVALSHRDNSSGAQDNETFNLYGYALPLNPAKTVKTLTLPDNSSVEVLALTLSNGSPANSVK